MMKRFEKYVLPVAVTAILLSGVSLYLTLGQPSVTMTIAVLDTQRILDRQKVKWLHGIREDSGNAMSVKRVEVEAQAFEKKLQEAVKVAIETLPETQKPSVVLDARSVVIDHSASIVDLTPEVLTVLQLDERTYRKERDLLLQDFAR